MVNQKQLKLGVIISGQGTNLVNIVNNIKSSELDANVTVVISNKPEAQGLIFAKSENIPTVVIDPKNAQEIIQALHNHEVELVVMAGYMRILPNEVLKAYPNRVMNLHPSLLPAFAGAQTIEKTFEKGVKITGATVHFANEILDEGPIIIQEAVEVCENDTLESLTAKIHEAEYRIYPKAIQLFAENKLTIKNGKVIICE